MLPASLEPVLRNHLRIERPLRYLFEGRLPGAPMRREGAQILWKKACLAAGVSPKGGIHSLRHSFATHLFENGTDIRSSEKYERPRIMDLKKIGPQAERG